MSIEMNLFSEIDSHNSDTVGELECTIGGALVGEAHELCGVEENSRSARCEVECVSLRKALD